MRRLVVTADDFGLSPGVVAGIIRAHEGGVVTATSLMVNAPATDEAFRYARSHPSIAAGLHFVLTFGRPVGPAEPLGALMDAQGFFRGRESGVHARVGPECVREELRAQLRCFEAAVGRAPTHIDGHHHIHARPGILRAVVDEAGQRGIAVRSPDDATRERLRIERIRTTDTFVEAFYGAEHVDETALLEILEALPEGTAELMCHPAEEDDSLGNLSSYVAPRYLELETLVSPRVRASLARLQIELSSAA